MKAEVPLAVGWGLKTTELPPAIIPIPLQMIVSEGFVHGVMEPMTPYGARSTRVRPWSPVQAIGRRSSVPG